MAKAQAFLSIQLQFIESLKDHFRREADSLAEGVKMVLEKGGNSSSLREAADEAIAKKQTAEQKIADLIGIALDLSTMDYSNVEQIRKACSLKILKVMYDIDFLKAKGLV